MAACVLLGCALPVTARLVAGPRGADVHVEWRPFVDDAMRERLTARYRLENPRKLRDTYTWRYELVDPSTDNIRALVNDPQLVLADEPTGNLDPDLSIEIMKLFSEINTAGTTVLVATHNPELIRFVGKRSIHLEHGRVDRGEESPL